MVKGGRIWVGNSEDGRQLFLLPSMANRHGLVAGATGSGKTVTLKVLAESFSEMGVPVFVADVKGDIASLMVPGEYSEDMTERIARFGLAEEGFACQGYPVTLWDIFGEKGIPLRTSVSEMGPVLLARILGLNELQSNVLSIVFKIADDADLLLVDTKDLKAMLNFVQQNASVLQAEYGKMAPASIGAIVRALVALEVAGGDRFFSEPALNIGDFLSIGEGGRGMINVLDSESLIHDGTLYSTFLLWLLSELFEKLPEVGDLDKPKMVFFFDEAHLLFKGTSRTLLDKIEQVVKLVRSKGVGIYFCTQNPKDIPDGVLAQLGNRIQHGLHAYTPADQRAVRAAADSFRANPAFKTLEAIQNLRTGEAVVSFLEEDGIPGICEKAQILPPKSRFGAISDEERDRQIKVSLLYSKYAEPVDPESAYELLLKRDAELALEAEKARLEAEAAKEAARAEKEAKKLAEQEARARKRAVKSIASTLVGTVGREAGKAVGGNFGSLGKTVGGNVGASLGRNILGTLFKT